MRIVMFLILLSFKLVPIALPETEFQNGKISEQIAIKSMKRPKMPPPPPPYGGKEVIPHSFPHHVSVQNERNGTWRHHCSGSIIEPTKILTTARCLYEKDGREFHVVEETLRVVAGDHDLKVNEGNEQVVTVIDLSYHPYFNFYDADYDYGVVHLAKPLKYNKYIAPIQLPSNGYVPYGKCINTGWGTSRGGKGQSKSKDPGAPFRLKEVTILAMDKETCIEIYKDIPQVRDTITESMVCAGNQKLKSSCYGEIGDAGGPLVCNGVLAGIKSWRNPQCGMGNYPGVYSNVALVLDWIKIN